MIVRLILLYLKIDFRNYFQSKLAFIGQLVGIYLNLLIYWYTSKILGEGLSETLGQYQMSYFEYLLIGDIILQSSMSLIEVNFNHFFMLKVNRMNDYIKTTNVGLIKIFVVRSISSYPRDFMFMLIYFLMGKLFFNLELEISELLLGIFLQLLIMPSFIGISLSFLGLFSVLGRGIGVIGYINTIAAIISGGYFPVEVLPEIISKNSLYLTPYNTLLYGYRTLLVNFQTSYLLDIILICLSWDIALLGLGLIVFKIFQNIEYNYDIKYIFEK